MGKRVNTTVKERKALLKELGYTEDEMQQFYDEAAEVNSKILALKNTGHKWTDLTVYQMRQLPGLKERTLEQLKEKQQEEEAKQAEEEIKQQERVNYKAHFEENMLKKIDAGEKLTEEELNTLVCEYEYDKEESADVYKNKRGVDTVVKLGDGKGSRFFNIYWVEDISSFGVNEFNSQPCEVVRVYDTVKIEKWVGKSIADQFEKVEDAEVKKNETETEKDVAEVREDAGSKITADTIDKIVDYMADHCIGCNIYCLTAFEIKEMREYLKKHISDIK